MPTRHRDDALGRRLQIGGPIRRGAVEILLGKQLAVDRHQYRPHPGQLGHAHKRRLKRHHGLDPAEGAGGEGPAWPRGRDAHRQQQETQPAGATGISPCSAGLQACEARLKPCPTSATHVRPGRDHAEHLPRIPRTARRSGAARKAAWRDRPSQLTNIPDTTRTGSRRRSVRRSTAPAHRADADRPRAVRDGDTSGSA